MDGADLLQQKTLHIPTIENRKFRTSMKKGVCGGGSHFLKCLGRKFFGEELKIFGFAWGGTEPG